MATVILPSTLRNLVDATDELDVAGATAGDVLERLEELHPRLRGWVLDEQKGLRQHVNVFVNDERAELSSPVSAGDELYVVQSISGGSAAGLELLVGTRKGLFVLRGERGGPARVGGRLFPGETVEYACRDPRTGTYFASVTHGQYGPRLFLADDLDGEWQAADGLVFPQDTDAAVERVWTVVPGEGDGVVWAGVAPAALFRSFDGGESWELVRSLWEVPGREDWQPGLGGLALHSICPWPGEPSRLAVGISAAGVWITDDGGESWQRGGQGLVPGYVPEPARATATNICVHNMHRAGGEPETLYMQFHGDVYRCDDGGFTWHDVSSGPRLPGAFGFSLVADPRDAGRAWVIPMTSDGDRVTVDGKVRVYETRDRGESWQDRSAGLPQEDAYLTVLRHAFCHDGGEPLGLYFGARSGEVFGSADTGATWTTLARHLPPILSVRHA